MEAVAQGIRQGEAAASGAAAITVEKHKSNFRAQHGTFSDKPSQNVTRWLQKAQDYRDAHMIQSLEMGSIVIHCIKGEVAVKVRRMLEVPGTHFIHADHFCQQDHQPAVPYSQYRIREEAQVEREALPELEELQRQVDADGNETRAYRAFRPLRPFRPATGLREAVPAILPVRYQPEVTADHCLKHYLLRIYEKRVNLAEADKFLNTFKTQKPKQTCSNYLDEFIINYENYAHLKWSTDQLNGTPRIPGPPIIEAIPSNIAVREAEILRIVTDGICKEFKIHCDNTGFPNMENTNFPELETAVNNWQRSSATGKAFTALCVQAKPTASATVAAMELDDYYDQANTSVEAAEDNFTSAIQTAPGSTRGQRGGRGARGGTRGGRGRGARGRGATTSLSSVIQGPFISRDIEDGNHPNYRQTQDGQLQRSIHGFPLCNYCGGPSHKRQHCPVKAHDRETGNKRLFHPDRDKGTSVQDKNRRPTTAPTAAASAVMQAPMMQQVPYQPMWQQPWANQAVPMTQQQWQQPPANQDYQQPPANQDYMGFGHKTAAANMTPITLQRPNPCPYPTCQAILVDQNQSENHMRMFHTIPTMAQGQGTHQ